MISSQKIWNRHTNQSLAVHCPLLEDKTIMAHFSRVIKQLFVAMVKCTSGPSILVAGNSTYRDRKASSVSDNSDDLVVADTICNLQCLLGHYWNIVPVIPNLHRS